MLIFFILCIILLACSLKCTEKNGVPIPFNQPLMFGRQSCSYTIKMIEELKKNNSFKTFKYINTETKEGSNLFQQYEGKGVPYFVSQQGRVHGFMKTSELFDKLNL